MSETTAPAPAQPIVATGGMYYRRMRYFVGLILIVAAGWFAYDGWVNWPRINQQIAQIQASMKDAEDRHDEHTRVNYVEQLKDLTPHNDVAIAIQKLLTFALPVLGIALSMWARHNSRGEIVLTDAELRAPGHPTVPLDAVVAVDRRLWDRKDIAYVDYDLAGKKGRVRLDAFVYEADPIVKMVDRLSALMQSDEPAEPPPAI